jgi:hypothetical protein
LATNNIKNRIKMIKSKLIAAALEKSDLPPVVIEELTIIIEALEGIDLTETEIINQLKEDYDIEI